MSAHKCCNLDYSGWSETSCGKPAKFTVDGKHYCGIHNPNKTPSAKQQRIADERSAKKKESLKQWRITLAAPELLAALQAIKDRLDTSPTHVMYASEVFDSFYQELITKAIAKATGGAA